MAYHSTPFDLGGRTAVVSGGTGTLGRGIAAGLAQCGASLAILARSADRIEGMVAEFRNAGVACVGVTADVLDRESLNGARDLILKRYQQVDILVNAAGGNLPGATIPAGGSFFDLDSEAFRGVVDLNLMGTVLPIQIFGPNLAATGSGSIINISSMAAGRSLSRVVAYGTAKAAVENLTRALAVHAAQRFGSGLRVNAVAPGFFLAEQNRDLLVRADGSLTERGEAIIAHTPMGRFGQPDDLVPTVVWLASGASAFVTGAVVPVDGGFSAFGGV